ncbi:hypothetical protein [Limibacterium fermenti]|uniref:hypothetical protein n=1 Tax=Limibacterium fermenti TaxID=3229863 RepID=UPI003A777C42
MVEKYFSALQSFCLVGPELLLGKIFYEIGVNRIKDRLFRHLVIARLVYPVNKLRTVDYQVEIKTHLSDKLHTKLYLDKDEQKIY